jgi:hypothetical protein
MKFVLLLSISSFLLIVNSYFKRTEAFNGNKLNNLAELINNQDKSLVQRFCGQNGFREVAYVNFDGDKIKTIVCANP